MDLPKGNIKDDAPKSVKIIVGGSYAGFNMRVYIIISIYITFEGKKYIKFL